MNRLKAIPTRYKQYLFRSRLEAQWAVFLDTVGWRWTYESEGFDFGCGDLYLPDFELQLDADATVISEAFRVWVEVKPNAPSIAEWRKAEMLARSSGGLVIFAIGNPAPESVDLAPAVIGCSTLASLVFGVNDGSFERTTASLSEYAIDRFKRPIIDSKYCMYVYAEETAKACAVACNMRFGRVA